MVTALFNIRYEGEEMIIPPMDVLNVGDGSGWSVAEQLYPDVSSVRVWVTSSQEVLDKMIADGYDFIRYE